MYSKQNIMPIQEQVTQLEWELKEVKRKLRKDIGSKRLKYNPTLSKRYVSYLRGAASRGIEFNLTPEQLEEVFKNNCVYCGTDNKIGVDRIDSLDSYNIDNIQPCCTTCNLMKRAMSNDTFLKQIARIYDKFVKK